MVENKLRASPWRLVTVGRHAEIFEYLRVAIGIEQFEVWQRFRPWPKQQRLLFESSKILAIDPKQIGAAVFSVAGLRFCNETRHRMGRVGKFDVL